MPFRNGRDAKWVQDLWGHSFEILQYLTIFWCYIFTLWPRNSTSILLTRYTVKIKNNQPTKQTKNPNKYKGTNSQSYTLYTSYIQPRRRQWHPTQVFLLGKSHGWRSLLGCSPWGRWESDTTERLHFHFSLFTFMHWRRKWQPTPVFLPGESQGRGSLVGCCLWGRTESDTTEVT